MPIVPIVHVSRRVTVEKHGTVRRHFACATCGYRAAVEIAAGVSARAEGSITESADLIATEARERADAALSDEMQYLLELVPCPKCGARSEDAGLYRQNTVLLSIACLGLGAGLGVYQYFIQQTAHDQTLSPRAALLGALAFGAALAGFCWYRRGERVRRVSRAVRFVEEDEASPRKRKKSRKAAESR